MDVNDRVFASGQVAGGIALLERGQPGFQELEYSKQLRLPAGTEPAAIVKQLVKHFRTHYFGLGVELATLAVGPDLAGPELRKKLQHVLYAVDRRSPADDDAAPARRREDQD